VRPCASSPCVNGGECKNLKKSYQCKCPGRYTGKRCQIRGMLTVRDVGQPERNSIEIYTNISVLNIVNKYFNMHVTKLMRLSCGKLKRLVSQTIYLVTYTLLAISFTIDQLNCLIYTTVIHFIESPCASGPCKNGGRCHQVAASFRCRCRPRYKGNLCEIKGRVTYIRTVNHDMTLATCKAVSI
jgi:hypothetical protein